MRDAAEVAGVGRADKRPRERGACSRVAANLPEVVAMVSVNVRTKNAAKRFVNDASCLSS